jgi:ubiquinone/menaquinone biosynthesis C-methylase UbiE
MTEPPQPRTRRSIEHSYVAVSRFFDAWVRIIEMHTRMREARDPLRSGAKVLVISPPTDAGIPLLVRANQHGETVLLCFSERLCHIATSYREARGIERLDIAVAPFFQMPFAHGEFAAVYANCFFDFCAEQEFDSLIEEIRRVLEPGGVLYAVYMAPPLNVPAHIWTWFFRHFDFLSKGVRPVLVEPHLSHHGFVLSEGASVQRLGFPMRFTRAQKRSA